MNGENMSKKWIEDNVKSREDGDISIECGHGVFEYFIALRPYNPHVYMLLCTPCYHRLLGFFLNEIKNVTVKMK